MKIARDQHLIGRRTFLQEGGISALGLSLPRLLADEKGSHAASGARFCAASIVTAVWISITAKLGFGNACRNGRHPRLLMCVVLPG